MDARIFKIGKQFSDSVRKDMEPDKIIIYGSYVRNEQTDDSDIDIAVIFNHFHGDEWKTSSDLCRKAWQVDNRIEPVLLDMSKDESGFCEYVMNVGIEV